MIDLSFLARTTDEIYSLDELKKKISSGKPLRIKYGVDVTAPFLHIGHAVNLWMMRYFQEQGHKVVFLVGDFTTRIGDPTGKSQTRKEIGIEEIKKNADEFIKQVGQVLLTTPDVFEVRRNSEWFENMPTSKFLSLLSMITHSKLIERDMFQKRIKNNQEIYMHEMLYPILQGYDSFMLKSDLTIVGSDQLFNELMGRVYQEKLGQEPQVVMTSKITAGIDGKEKQSKSLGNYIALADTPSIKFGKVMSIPDDLIIPYFKVYTEYPLPDIEKFEIQMSDKSNNPMEFKKMLAYQIVLRYHGQEVAEYAEKDFVNTFKKGGIPEDAKTVSISKGQPLVSVLLENKIVSSKTDFRRLIKEGAISDVNSGVKILDEKAMIVNDIDLKIGKQRFIKIRIKK